MRGPKRTAPSDRDRALICEIFENREETYDEATLLRLTRSSRAQVAAVASEPLNRIRGYKWEELAWLAMERWTPRMIHGVLRDFLPPLNQTATIPIELPIYQIRALHWCALADTRRGEPARNASDIVEATINLQVLPDYLDGAGPPAPDIKAAADFPYFLQLPRPPYAACRYCGSHVTVDKEPCASCAALHEPLTGDRK